MHEQSERVQKWLANNNGALDADGKINEDWWECCMEFCESNNDLLLERKAKIREEYADGATLSELAEPYNKLGPLISEGTIAKIVEGVVQKSGPRSKLTPQQMESIRGSYKNHFATQAQLAEFYSVNQATISRVLKE